MSDYRYAVVTHGINYAPGDVTTAADCIMVDSLADARELLRDMASNRGPWQYWETGDGALLLETPCYGEPGDGATIYRLPDRSPVIDIPGDRARHAWAHLTNLGRTRPEPSHYVEFGPRGGITITAA